MSGSASRRVRPEVAVRAVVGLLGLAAAAYGAVLLLGLDGADLLDTVLWMAGGVVLHDAVVAPLTVLATVLLVRVVPASWRTSLTVGLVVLLGVTATAVPVLGRFGARSDNPTLLDRDYTGGWLLLAAAVLLLALVVPVVARRVRAAGGPGAPRRR
ncbi:hypothetical protein SAMN04488570_1746 [Nocardioides scoriae]|uniref:Uncharacterized protein n=1 Tax=Nocardioides scoriae TaxID=642780 RepID=A0A1H1RQ33_9ACTN|nr:hypothetical protein [Nocardioides scoriae]SDS37773.1 hypothetical protein SAMN04488570_1746 [Nocardioides scoriae]